MKFDDKGRQIIYSSEEERMKERYRKKHRRIIIDSVCIVISGIAFVYLVYILFAAR